MMNGKMWVESVFGKGSTFICEMPLEFDLQAQKTKYDTSSLHGKRALIVDDVAVNQTILKEHLHAWNMRSDAVNGGDEALTALKEAVDENDPYDLILLDYLMPKMNGQDLARLVFSDPNIPRTAVIMLSSSDQPASDEELALVDIEAYLIKPVREQRLFDTLIKSMKEFSAKVPPQIQAQGKALPTAVELAPNPSPIVASSAPTIITRETSVQDYLVNDTSSPSTPINISLELLVAEDFVLNQDVVRLMLADTVFNPVFANNGQEAVDMFTTEPNRFNLILMDISMPVMDGYTACENILDFEKINNLPHTPIIALTGHALKHDKERCLAVGMDAYLTKPVKQVKLIETLEHWATQVQNTARSA